MDYLAHHGVKGQQWGIKNGPPYPINKENHPVYIKKGTKFKRLSIHDESVSSGHAYVNYLKSDSRRYRGFFGARLKAMNNNAKVYSIELEAAKDLMAPSKQERVKTFIEMFNNDPQLRKELGSYYKDDYHNFAPLSRKFYERAFSELSQDKLETKGYETFVKAIGGNQYVRDAYFQELAKKGYHFVTDDMDAGVFGKEPAIILDRQESTVYRGQKEISNKEIQDTWKKEGTYLNESVAKERNRSPIGNAKKNVENLVDDIVSSNTLQGDVGRQVQYYTDFGYKTLKRVLKGDKW